jgi:glutathione synthase/RimK-type ligase-like ATP-grasp enzyme
MILLWGLPNDPPLKAVRQQLESLCASVVFADQSAVLRTQIALTVGETVSASLCCGAGELDLTRVTAAYLRPYSSCDLPDIGSAGPDSAQWRHAIQVDDIISSWAEISAAFLVNPLGAMAVNNSKPYQMEQIRQEGWSVPETLITTDPEAAREFWENHGDAIYKSVSSIRSQVRRIGPEHNERLADIGSCPTQFQSFIPGRDHRVHVVGDEVFACEICCDADDYRYPGDDDVEIRARVLPREIEDRCRRTAQSAGLPFTGIDLRRTAEGEWFCFELNPSPGFTFYEHRTGQPIAQAVARLLVEQSRRREVDAN